MQTGESIVKRSSALGSFALVAAMVAACGGSAATQGPAGGASGPAATAAGGATTPAGQPEATQAGNGSTGNKPAGWDQYGKVHIDVGGPVSKSGDYGFVPAGSIFGGAQGASLNFTIDGSDEVVSIVVGPDGKVLVSYG